jgi:glutamine synthetase
MIREAALRHDCFATFMAKPIEGEPGSAMHIHHSVVDLKTGKNIFTRADGGETPAFMHFIGGMQRTCPRRGAAGPLCEQLPPLCP